MSITDELRKYAQGFKNSHDAWSGIGNELDAIADRIDAERESACAEAYGNGVESVALPDLTGYVKLPKDADGEYIRAGDMLDGYGKTIEVVELRYGRSGWVLISRDGNAYADTYAFSHHRPDTWERIIEDAVNVHGNGFNPLWTDERDALVARCKKLVDDGKEQ